jgi:hypothetical protein
MAKRVRLTLPGVLKPSIGNALPHSSESSTANPSTSCAITYDSDGMEKAGACGLAPRLQEQQCVRTSRIPRATPAVRQ